MHYGVEIRDGHFVVRAFNTRAGRAYWLREPPDDGARLAVPADAPLVRHAVATGTLITPWKARLQRARLKS